jgi:hypothetical protein
MKATVKGKIGVGTGLISPFTFTDQKADIIEDSKSSSVTWEVTGGTGTKIDGLPASGPFPSGAAATARTFSATGIKGNYKLNVTGTITGPTGDPPSCTGSGDWTLFDGATQIGTGKWTIP